MNEETDKGQESDDLSEEELDAVAGGGKVFPKVEIEISQTADLNTRMFNPQPEPPAALLRKRPGRTK